MNIHDVNTTIQKLEQGETTFENCQKLASLYIIRDKYIGETEKELNDILPQYKKYVDIKRKYQLGEVSEKLVERQIKIVCKEISEFIHTMYAGTDMPEERKYIENMITGLQKSP